jgi:hypothetical protein
MGEPHAVASRVIDAVNAHDLGALGGLYAADARTRRPGWPQASDAAALLASYEMDFACVPDIEFEPVSTLTDGSHVVTEIRITGTNTGPTVTARVPRAGWRRRRLTGGQGGDDRVSSTSAEALEAAGLRV